MTPSPSFIVSCAAKTRSPCACALFLFAGDDADSSELLRRSLSTTGGSGVARSVCFSRGGMGNCFSCSACVSRGAVGNGACRAEVSSRRFICTCSGTISARGSHERWRGAIV
eukprot:2306323-Rhodomonas_salina.1